MYFNSETDGHAADFSLSYLEEEVRSELGDSTAKITQTTEGRVSVDIEEDLLQKFLNALHAPKGINKNWGQRKDMRREMHSLKAQLKEAQAKCNLVSEENADLKSKMEKICTMLQQTQRESQEKLDQMKEENEALQNRINKLDQMKEDNEALQNKINKLDQMKEDNEALQNKNNKLDQMKEETERSESLIEEQKTLDVMDFKPETDGHAADLYLGYLEEEVRSELGDSTAMITQTTQGRVSVDIQEDLLEEFLNELHVPKDISKNWSQERKDMRRENHSLKAQLKEAQAKCNLMNQMKDENEALQNKINKLVQMKEENEALQNKINKLDQMKEENKALRGELEAMKLELRSMAEHNEFEARFKAEQLEADLAFEKTQAQKFQAKLSKVEESFRKHKEEAKKSAEQSQASYQTQHEELRKISFALKKSESLIEQQKTSHLETKAFYVSQLNEQKQRNDILVAARESVETQFESERVEWQKERSSLIQSNECLMETLQDKEQEWKENKRIMTTHIEGLHTCVVEKMKKKKMWWF